MPSSVTPGDPATCTSRNRGRPASRSEPGVGHALALVELDLLERRHAPQNLQAAVGDLRQPRVVVPQRQAGDVFGGGVCRLAAVHARQAFQLRATADVGKAGIDHVNRRELAKRRELRQHRQRPIADVLAAHAEASKGRQLRERDESAVAQVRALAAPQRLQRRGVAQRLEPRVCGDRALGPQPAKARQRGEMPHRHVVAQRAVGAKHLEIGQVDQMREPIGGDGRDVPEQVELADALEPCETREPVVGKRAVNQQVSRAALLDGSRLQPRK